MQGSLALRLAFMLTAFSLSCAEGTLQSSRPGDTGQEDEETSGVEDVPEEDTEAQDATEDAVEDVTEPEDVAEDEEAEEDVGDPFEAGRQLCYDTINALRASNGKPALARWEDGEGCADEQATTDQQVGVAQASKGDCGEHTQNACLGHGVGRVDRCIEGMWDERSQLGCTGCDDCAAEFDVNCPNCDYFGTKTGFTCGHYVNLNADYYTQVACGFSDEGGWVVINLK